MYMKKYRPFLILTGLIAISIQTALFPQEIYNMTVAPVAAVTISIRSTAAETAPFIPILCWSLPTTFMLRI
jgi:hypothetical protein